MKKALQKFIHTETLNGRRRLIIRIFKIKLSFNLSLKNKTNHIFLKKSTGELKSVKKIKGLKIKFRNSNSTVIVHEPIIKFKNCNIELGENCLFEVGAKTKDKMSRISKVDFVLTKNSKVIIGDDFYFGSGNVVLSDNSNLTIGNDCMLSYNLTFRIGDGHTILNSETKEKIGRATDVTIGDRVWIGINSTILKNAQIANDTIVGACSVVTKKFDKQNVAIAGNPAKIVKENIAWEK